MWTRKELKDRAKATLQKNYWKAVIAGILFLVATGSLSLSSGVSFSDTSTGSIEEDIASMTDDIFYQEDVYFNEVLGGIGDGYVVYEDGTVEDVDEDYYSEADSEGYIALLIVTIIVAFVIVFIIAFILAMVFMTFLGNPLMVGVQKFFNRALETKGDLNHVVSGFTNNYKNTIKVMFFRDLYVILWSLLFIIPGIIKSYEYLMIPYILGDNPDISKEDAFALSKQMMMGHKWEAFVLELSFIGWMLLSVCTFGILNIFYVTPYMQYTTAALYRKLSGKDEVIEVQA